jgi:hypothetical protein
LSATCTRPGLVPASRVHHRSPSRVGCRFRCGVPLLEAPGVLPGVDVVEHDVIGPGQMRSGMQHGVQFRKVFVRVPVAVARSPMKPPVQDIPEGWVGMEWVHTVDQLVLGANIPNQFGPPILAPRLPGKKAVVSLNLMKERRQITSVLTAGNCRKGLVPSR